VKPEYTEEALEAEIEGEFVMKVYVDERGQVTKAICSKKVGYGMDAVLEAAARSAIYEASRDLLGNPVASWESITFQLILP